MAVTTTVSNHFLYMQGTKKIDFDNDVIKIILMTSAFAFDKATHSTLADVTAYQISTGNGYTQDSKVLAGVTVTEDDTEGGLIVTWSDPIWTASGGSIGPTGSCIIYDDTTDEDTVIMCIDLGADITVPETLTITVKDVTYKNLTA